MTPSNDRLVTARFLALTSVGQISPAFEVLKNFQRSSVAHVIQSCQMVSPAIVGHFTPSSQSARRFYLPELDSLRFFAFLAVFIAHLRIAFGVNLNVAAQIGAFGVDLFFTLSAYLLTELLMREKEQTGDIDALAFYIRRGLRIWPLYFAFLTALFVASLCSVISIPPLWFAFFAVFMGNFALYASCCLHVAMSPLWSVSVEEQFYAVWPWVAKPLSRQGLIVFAIIVWLLSVWFRVHLLFGAAYETPERIWYFTLARLDPIACGILISAARIRVAVSRYWLVLVGIGLWALAGYLGPDSHEANLICMLLAYPAVALGCGAFLLATLGATNQVMRSTHLIYLGRISYGLYVFHTSAFTIAAAYLAWLPTAAQIIVGPPVAFALTLAAASASYRFYEAPFLRLKRRFEYVPSR
jgi:peptidoglycan/LPS O-acetylase OafA/YrhL